MHQPTAAACASTDRKMYFVSQVDVQCIFIFGLSGLFFAIRTVGAVENEDCSTEVHASEADDDALMDVAPTADRRESPQHPCGCSMALGNLGGNSLILSSRAVCASVAVCLFFSDLRCPHEVLRVERKDGLRAACTLWYCEGAGGSIVLPFEQAA